jgi:hypothetical protein
VAEHTNKVLLCSNCFENEGLRLETQRQGTSDGSECPNCGSTDGAKIDLESLNAVVDNFFVFGTKPSIYSLPLIIKQNPDHPLSPGGIVAFGSTKLLSEITN